MQSLAAYINQLKPLLLRLTFLIVAMGLTRVIFFLSNQSGFNGAGLEDFAYGTWIDMITVCLCFIPFAIIEFIPARNRLRDMKDRIQFYHYILLSALMLALNLMDVAYFPFTGKRTSSELWHTYSDTSDVSDLLLTYLFEFWWLILLLITFVWILGWLYHTYRQVEANINWTFTSLNFLLVLPFFIVIGRGGIGLKPTSPIDVARYCEPEQVPLVLNTPFSMIKSFGNESLILHRWVSPEKERKLFNPLHTSRPANILPDRQNVVIIILESFGKEHTGEESDPKSYAPFFDSLCSRSLFFEYGIANGKKSIEALPAIIGSMPSWMDNPYISSPYCNNRMEALPMILKSVGYESGFFHGATNGSMRFDSYAAAAGFDHYFGRSEYNNDKHFDQRWGIPDGYFNPWTALKINRLREPFFATLFTISSHHPYTIPAHRKGKVLRGKHPICAAINYSDWALRQFFNVAKKQPWYKNTLFVLVADHTPASSHYKYSTRQWMYRIPIAFFHPSGKLPVKKERKILQQIDIMPTLLDILNVKKRFYAMGSSYFSQETNEAISYLEGTYHYFQGDYLVLFQNGKMRNAYNFRSKNGYRADSLPSLKGSGQIRKDRFKAIIQRYNRDLIMNQTTIR